jgi:hypothetical protein
MPIRHCQKCGLKVLIDESQAAANPFYCQRCTTAMKSSDQPEPAPAASGNTPVRRDVPQAVTAPSAAAAPAASPSFAAPSSPGPSRATVKVLCPYCKASFNGRVPQKPARGACPVCQKELILLPNGDIRPSSGFDVAKWQDEVKSALPPPPEEEPEPVRAAGPPPVPEKQSGTRLLIKKYAAEAPPAAAKADTGTRILSRKQAEPTPVPLSKSPEPQEPQAELPEWLDDKKPSRPTTDEIIRSKEQQRDPAQTEAEEDLPAESLESPGRIEEPAPVPVKPRILIKPPGARPAAAPPPPPPPPPEPELLPEPEPEPPPAPAARPAQGPKRPGTVRRPEPAAPAFASSEATGGGKVFVAWAIVVLPLVACPVLLNSRDKFKDTPVVKLGGMFRKGFFELDKKLFPPPPPPKALPPPPEEKKVELPPEPPPKPDPDQRKKEDIRLQHLNDEILRLTRDEKGFRVAESPEQKKKYDELHSLIEDKKGQYKRGCEMYKQSYGEEFQPNR